VDPRRLNAPSLWCIRTVITSAIVAAIVTLSIEYLAKPRLEARKERILEDARFWRKLRASANLIAYDVGALLAIARDRAYAFPDRVAKLHLALETSHAEFGEWWKQSEVEDEGLEFDLLINLYAGIEAYLYMMKHDQSQAELDRMLEENFSPLVDVVAEGLDAPKWRPIKRMRVARRFEALRMAGIFPT
jgi:hypothetical protein